MLPFTIIQRLICVDHTATCNTLQQAVQLPHTNELAAAAVEAHARIQGHVLCTNLMHSHWLSSAGGCSAFLKLESEQHTNSFKVGGASRPDTWQANELVPPFAPAPADGQHMHIPHNPAAKHCCHVGAFASQT